MDHGAPWPATFSQSQRVQGQMAWSMNANNPDMAKAKAMPKPGVGRGLMFLNLAPV